jgi:hypothetical protein
MGARWDLTYPTAPEDDTAINIVFVTAGHGHDTVWVVVDWGDSPMRYAQVSPASGPAPWTFTVSQTGRPPAPRSRTTSQRSPPLSKQRSNNSPTDSATSSVNANVSSPPLWQTGNPSAFGAAPTGGGSWFGQTRTGDEPRGAAGFERQRQLVQWPGRHPATRRPLPYSVNRPAANCFGYPLVPKPQCLRTWSATTRCSAACSSLASSRGGRRASVRARSAGDSR